MENVTKIYLSEAEKQLHSGKLGKLFLKFAVPGVITLLFLGLQAIIDGAVIGNFVGANALASVSLTLPCYSFISAVCIVMGVGCQTLVSIRLGEMNRKGANDAAKSALVFLLTFTISVSIIVFCFAPNVARMLGANDILLNDSVDYLHHMIPFVPFIGILFFCDHLLKATGRPVFATSVMSGTVIMNIILDLIFVGAWDCGTAGAGLATGISFTLGAMVSSVKIFGNTKIINVIGGKFKNKLVWQMFYNGSSEGMNELSVGISTLVFNLTLMKYIGENGVAAFTAITYLFFISITIILGVSDGIIPIISYNFGANQWTRVKRTLWMAIRTNLIIGVILFIIMKAAGEQIISLFFKSGETNVIDIAVHGTSIYAYALLLIGVNILSSSYFTAIANAKISLIISLLRGLILVIIGITIFPKILGIDGIWYAVPFAECGTFIVSVLLLKWSFKKGNAMKNLANI